MKKTIFNNKKKLVVSIIFLLLVVAWLAQVLYINLTETKTVYRYYDIGEECYYKGCNIQVLGYEYMSDRDFVEKYNLSLSDLYYDINRVQKSIYIVELKLTKMIECDKESDVYLSYDLGPGLMIKAVSVTESIGCDRTFAQLLESNYVEEYKQMKVGESIVKKFPFAFVDNNLVDFYKENFDSYPMYIQMQDYEEQQYICRMKVNNAE